MQLAKRLQDHVAVRGALEQALGYKSSSIEIPNGASISKVILLLWLQIRASVSQNFIILDCTFFGLAEHLGMRALKESC